MVEAVNIQPVLWHLSLNIPLFGDVLPELAWSAGARNSTSETDDDSGVLDLILDSSHFDD